MFDYFEKDKNTEKMNHSFFSLLGDKMIYIMARGSKLPAKRATINNINIINLQINNIRFTSTSNSTSTALIIP